MSDKNNLINELVNVIQDCNINFLIGSGLSMPFLTVLGNIENLLTQLDEKKLDEDLNKIVKVSIYKEFFDSVIFPNVMILQNSDECKSVLDNYKYFLTIFTDLMNFRKNTLLSRQANIFTTNVDLFLEKSMEDLQIDFNDGFKGRFRPIFEPSEFKKSIFKKSLQYDNSSEIPVYNILKIHGSLTWAIYNSKVVFSDLKLIAEIAGIKVEKDVVDIKPFKSVVEIVDQIKKTGKTLSENISLFLEKYEKLAIVNPTKEKFASTILNETYYELLRMYANELEKENTVLFVAGFSMSDEHIRNLTIRAAKSNPTLKIYIICYNNEHKKWIESNLKKSGEIRYSNIDFISPTIKFTQLPDGSQNEEDEFLYDFENINNKIFKLILENVNLNKIKK